MNKSSLFAVAVCVIPLFVACGGMQPADGRDSESGDGQVLTRAELEDLAVRYLFEVGDEQTLKAIASDVQNLAVEESLSFSEILRAMARSKIESSLVSPETLAEFEMMMDLSQSIDDIAKVRGVNRFALETTEIERLADSINKNRAQQRAEAALQSCWPKAFCYTTTYTHKNYGGSCVSGCYGGSGYDRVSNEMCEDGTCDHRIFYATPYHKLGVSGTTPAARCVINHYGHAISRYESGYTQLGFGILGPAACLILFGVSNYLMDYTVVF